MKGLLSLQGSILITVGYLVALIGGHFFTKLILGKFQIESNAGGMKRAGAVIGHLERALLLTFMLMKSYELIGFVVMAKSIARFEELKDRTFAEYFLIGTLASTLFAVLVGVVILLLN